MDTIRSACSIKSYFTCLRLNGPAPAKRADASMKVNQTTVVSPNGVRPRNDLLEANKPKCTSSVLWCGNISGVISSEHPGEQNPAERGVHRGRVGNMIRMSLQQTSWKLSTGAVEVGGKELVVVWERVNRCLEKKPNKRILGWHESYASTLPYFLSSAGFDGVCGSSNHSFSLFYRSVFAP
ncbi:kinesin-like protein KIF20A [Anopheles sinensis]|uniref:Kinesin-like protein KIF20A n=1 Tax=Anopheles sinensis TaxID=74873 RepID=A0A084WAY0_ANOSI|nr:kinesin-like protein KIF20A [Anopheles sinensis]